MYIPSKRGMYIAGGAQKISHTHIQILKRQRQETFKGKLSFIIGYLRRSLGCTSHS